MEKFGGLEDRTYDYEKLIKDLLTETEIKGEIASAQVQDGGKDICNKKREMRNLFAKANNIPYVPSECTYDGPCSGTCRKCEEETAKLMDSAKQNKEVIYPKYDVERGDL